MKFYVTRQKHEILSKITSLIHTKENVNTPLERHLINQKRQ